MKFARVATGLADGLFFTRKSWPEGTFIFLVPESVITIDASRPLGQALPHKVGEEVRYMRHIDVFTGDSNIVQPYVPTTDALIADDWMEVSHK